MKEPNEFANFSLSVYNVVPYIPHIFFPSVLKSIMNVIKDIGVECICKETTTLRYMPAWLPYLKCPFNILNSNHMLGETQRMCNITFHHGICSDHIANEIGYI